MSEQNHKWGYWTKERCSEEAAKYDTRFAFRNGSPGAYSSAYTHGWISEICQHMRLLRTYYSMEECAEEASKYDTKTEFLKKAPLHYSHAIRKGFLNEICGHMKKQGNPQMRVVYAFEFEDNYAYIGLTSNPHRREKEHLVNSSSAVCRHIQSLSFPDFSRRFSFSLAKSIDTFWEVLLKGFTPS